MHIFRNTFSSSSLDSESDSELDDSLLLESELDDEVDSLPPVVVVTVVAEVALLSCEIRRVGLFTISLSATDSCGGIGAGGARSDGGGEEAILLVESGNIITSDVDSTGGSVIGIVSIGSD